ncbi:angiotensin-converting enzyme-like isoform X2 [Anthonomus grandis grandis]|uniref:angiotensin-converting enzyme-like isoform X2 n=1 Tax=Anthonomus grandis grandis TaxID=2921223 RepID=UPI0021654891|nr:angiotensin-converting enzyme-like isoform X2 [Anthonomus grandis grandis]
MIFSLKMLYSVALLGVVLMRVVYAEYQEVEAVQASNVNLDHALQFLREYDSEASGMCFRVSSAQWAYSTNMTDFNKRRMIEEQTLKAKFDKVTWRKAMEFDWDHISDPVARRQLRMLIARNRASLSDEKYNEIHHLISEMKDLYAHVRICPYTPDPHGQEATYCDLDLSDIQRIMAKSRNHLELLHMWKEWHDKTGPPMKNKFMRYVDLANQAAIKNGFSHAGEETSFVYETADFQDELVETFRKILPLYKELFAYVRSRLYKKYGPEVVRPDGPLPAHILGNLWAQDWRNIYDIVAPYPEYGGLDVTGEMLQQGFTPLRMFQMAEEFFTSLGLKPMPPEFWRWSMIEKPNSRKVQCTASAWDFCNKIDFRIKQCTEVNMENLISTHREMAHIEYYMYYAEQPYLYRDGANPGFHDGVANAVLLSVFNPIHLYRIGLSNNSTDLYERNINFLMLIALQKVAYAPFAYLIDLWRNQIFERGVNKMNAEWWSMRLRYQGVVPPVGRAADAHFDAAAKRHVAADVAYVKYYVALLLEFQIYGNMCDAAAHKGPLHTCDVYRSREAGRVLSDILRVGKARHWKDVLKMLTKGRTDKLSADRMIEYFKPLLLWLQSSNRNEPVIGWMTSKEDLALYQPLVKNGQGRTHFSFINSVIVLLLWVVVVYQK